MKLERSRSQEQIFTEMHRELRSWNPDVPESRERLDPVLRMLLQLYSNQLSKIEKRVDMVWEVATSSLVTSLFPDCKRWPVPAFTVVRCELTDPVVEVDPDTSMIYRERREGGQTFFFSPHRSQKLLAADVKYVFLKNGDTLLDIRKRSEGETRQLQRPSVPISPDRANTIFIAVDFGGSPAEFENSLLFLQGNPQALKQIRWSYWYPGTATEHFSEEHGFCPGLTTTSHDMFGAAGDDPLEWGGLRSTDDLFGSLEDNFVMIPGRFASAWQKGPIDNTLGDLAFQSGIELPGSDLPLYWIRLDLPEGGDREKLDDPVAMMWNCFVATNRSELKLFKHTGGNKLVEIELPEHISRILEISSVVDSEGRDYRPSYEVRTDPSQRSYAVEERDAKLVLWFDFPSVVETPPDSMTVTYSVTSGVDANGIEAGHIDEFYESHPGIASCVNLTQTTGAIPAKTKEQIVMEAKSRLRNRDRALSFQELSKWAIAFDRRIRSAECANSTERTGRGVARCISVLVKVSGDDFHSHEETELLRTRLKSFLKSRSSVNTRFKVEIVAV